MNKTREQEIQDSLGDEKLDLHKRLPLKHLLDRHYRILKEYIEPEGDIIELGCGIGDFLEFVVKNIPGRNCLGVDISNNAVEIANSRLGNHQGGKVTAVVGDIDTLQPVINETEGFSLFKTVILRGVVHHLPDPQNAFNEIFKVLEPGGSVIVLEGNASSSYRKLILGLADMMNIQHEASQFPHLPPNTIIHLFKNSGFSFQKTIYLTGAFAPLAYYGVGGKTVWQLFDRVDSIAHKINPSFFGWWVLIQMQKPFTES